MPDAFTLPTDREALLDLAENKESPIEALLAAVTSNPDDIELCATVMITVDQRTSVYDPQQGAHPLLGELLARLALCDDMSVRWGVAKNIHTPVAVLETLAADPVNLVRALVATNPHTPVALLTRLFGDEKIVRDGLSGNRSTPAKYLAVLADDADRMVRLRVADNPSTDPAVLAKLATDNDPDVAKAAQLAQEKHA